MVLSRMVQDKLNVIEMQDAKIANGNQQVLTITLSRNQLQDMSEEDVLHCALMIYRWQHLNEDERKAIGQLIHASAQHLCKVLSGSGHLGGEAWGLIEKAIGVDIYEIWRNVKKGKP